MNTTRKEGIFAPRIFTMAAPKERSTPMENGRSLSTYPMNTTLKASAKVTKSTRKPKDWSSACTPVLLAHLWTRCITHSVCKNTILSGFWPTLMKKGFI